MKLVGALAAAPTFPALLAMHETEILRGGIIKDYGVNEMETKVSTYMKGCVQSICGSARKNGEAAAAESGKPAGPELIPEVPLISDPVGVAEHAESASPPVRAEPHHSSAISIGRLGRCSGRKQSMILYTRVDRAAGDWDSSTGSWGVDLCDAASEGHEHDRWRDL